jgi:uncharacterized phiE125 gp8 family phage protein
MARTLVTAPTSEPITTQEAKDHLRITTTDDDTLISAMIVAVREYVENVTSRALITQTWDIFYDQFAEVELPKPPLQSITTIKYIDTDGVQQTVSASVYTVDTDSDPGRVYLAYNQSWPGIRGINHAVEIRIVAGYGTASAVPQPIKHAMLLMIGHLYENREATAPLTISEIPMAVDALLAPYRVVVM